MLLLGESAIALASAFIATISTLLIFYRFWNSPINEAKLLAAGALLLTIYFYSVLPAVLLNDISTLNPITLEVFKLAPVFGHMGILFLNLAIILPTHSNSYKSIFFIIFITALSVFAACINYYTITFSMACSK